jgi:hypothetical protein
MNDRLWICDLFEQLIRIILIYYFKNHEVKKIICRNLSVSTWGKNIYCNTKTVVTDPNVLLLRNHSFIGSVFMSLVVYIVIGVNYLKTKFT